MVYDGIQSTLRSFKIQVRNMCCIPLRYLQQIKQSGWCKVLSQTKIENHVCEAAS